MKNHNKLSTISYEKVPPTVETLLDEIEEARLGADRIKSETGWEDLIPEEETDVKEAVHREFGDSGLDEYSRPHKDN